MSAPDEANQQLSTLYWTERALSNPIKWGILVSGAALLIYWQYDGMRPMSVLALAAYGVQNLAFTLLFSRAKLSLRVAKLFVLISYAFDFLFVGYLIFGLGGTASQVAFLMYITLIFKAGLYYPVFKESLLVLPVAISFYIITLAWQEGAQTVGEHLTRPRLFLLIGIPAVTIYTARLLERRERHLWDLNRHLRLKTVELKRQTSELQAVIQCMHDALLVTDARLNVVATNPVARAILGTATAAKVPVQLEASENGRALLDTVCEALTGPEGTSRQEVRFPRPNEGEEEARSYQAVASYVPAEHGTEARVVVILRDVTEQQRLEDAKSNFLSVVSHELRTPLSSIKGFLNIILEGRAGLVNDTQREFLTIAGGQAEYLHTMVNDLVEFSRIQVHRTDLYLVPVSAAEVCRAVTARLMPLAQEKDIAVVEDAPPDLPPIEGDRLQLEQVLSNLIVNAIKFTPEGGRIMVRVQETGGNVTFAVEDTGVGIPSDQYDKIFQPFYQVSDGPARLHGGMGLGLAICAHIIERHGGRISVESAPGVGSTFRFTLPTHTTSQPEASLSLAAGF